MATRYFRAGVGTVIYNEAGQVALFRRLQYPMGIWQFQQGGIDIGEHLTVTLWRELKEEVGLTKDAILHVTEMPRWTVYEDIHAMTDHDVPRVGQAHRWFFLKLKAACVIDITQATDNEFDEYKWVSFEEAVNAASDNKRHVYETLQSFFITHVLK